MTAESPQQPEPISDLTAAARDTYNDLLGFMDARSRAAAAAVTRNAGLSLEAAFAEYDATQDQVGTEQLPPPPTDSHQ